MECHWWPYYHYLLLLWPLNILFSNNRQIFCVVPLEWSWYLPCTMLRMECLLGVYMGRCIYQGGCTSWVVFWLGGGGVNFSGDLGRGGFFWILASVIIVDYHILHPMCLLRTYPCILASVGWSGKLWRIQTFFLFKVPHYIYIYGLTRYSQLTRLSTLSSMVMSKDGNNMWLPLLSTMYPHPRSLWLWRRK